MSCSGCLKSSAPRTPKGALLIEAYLDRRSHGWRDQRSDSDAREEPRQPRRRGRMTSKEAYDVLGLEAGAREEADSRCSSKADDEAPPDQGGSTYLASRINEAKEVLLGANECGCWSRDAAMPNKAAQ
jgi:hypothetical protein